jgi:hypothetical protein
MAGSTYAGQVGGYTKVISVTPTVEASPDYSDEDVMGGKQSIASAARSEGGSGIINFISVSSKVDITVGIRVHFFKSDPSATTFTENATLALNAADYDKVLGHVDIAAADWADLGTPNIATKTNINIPFNLPASVTTLYAVCTAQGTINLGSTSDLTFNYGILQD